MKLVLSPLAVLLLLILAPAVRAAEEHPLPEFSNYSVPQTQTPAARAGWQDWADLGFLVLALSAASYFAVRGRSRAGLYVLSIVSLAWLGFWRKGCVCPIGSIQNVTQSVFDSNYAVGGMVIAVFAIPLVFTLFFGRSFCASVCPLGAVQELVAVRPVQVPTWIDQAARPVGLYLSRCGSALCSDRLRLDHLPLRPVRRTLPHDVRREDAGPERRVPGRGAGDRPTLLPLALSLWSDPRAIVQSFLASFAYSTSAVCPMPAMRRLVSVRREFAGRPSPFRP